MAPCRDSCAEIDLAQGFPAGRIPAQKLLILQKNLHRDSLHENIFSAQGSHVLKFVPTPQGIHAQKFVPRRESTRGTLLP